MALYQLTIGCRFNLIRSCPKPNKLKLDKKTNVETKSVTKRYIPVIKASYNKKYPSHQNYFDFI